MSDERKVIQGLIQDKSSTDGKKADETPWTRIAFKLNGNTYSTFEHSHNEFNVGDEVHIAYEQKGEYNNIKAITLIKEANQKMEVPVETVGYEPNERQKEITLGQAANLALKHIHYNKTTGTPEELDPVFKEQTKRFYKLLQEVQKDLL